MSPGFVVSSATVSPPDKTPPESKPGPPSGLTQLLGLVPATGTEGVPFSRLLRGGAWVIWGTSVTQACGLATAILCARMLGKESFGEYGLLRSTVFFLALLAGAGLGLAATKGVAEFRQTDPARAGRIIGLLLIVGTALGLGGSLVTGLFSNQVAGFLLGHDSLSNPLRLGSLLLTTMVLNGIQAGVLAGLEQFRSVARLNVTEAILTLGLVALGAWHWGVGGALAGLALTGLLMVPLRHTVLRTACREAGMRIQYRIIPGEMNHLWQFALPAVLLGVAVQPFEWWARVSLGRGPDGLAELGVFTSAFALSQVVQFLPQQLGQPALPILTQVLQSGDVSAVRKLLLRLTGVFMMAASVVTLGLILFGEYALALFGRGFGEGTGTLLLLCLAYVIATLARVCSLVLMAAGRMWRQTVHSLVWGLVLTGAFTTLVEPTGMGLAWSYLSAFAVFLLLQAHGARAVLRGYGK